MFRTLRSCTSLLRSSSLRHNFLSRHFRATSARFADDRTAPAAAGQMLMLTFVTPNETVVNNKPVYMVSIPASSGVMGILGEHAPTIAQLQPGVVTIHGNDVTDVTHQFFVSSGFAVVKNDSSCQVTVVEAIPLEELDVTQSRNALDQAKEQLSRATNDQQRAEAEIKIEVYESVIAALEQK